MAESENVQYKVTNAEEAADAKTSAVEAQKQIDADNNTEQKTEGDGLILGKFKSQEDLAKAYSELEKKLGGDKADGKQEEKKEAPKQEDGANQIPAEFQKFQEEFVKDGKLSETSYKELEGRGYSKFHIDDYIATKQQLAALAEKAQASIVEQDNTSIVAEAGGEEPYNEMVVWAKDNLSKDEAVAYNKIMNVGTIAEKRLAVRGLRSQFQEANGKPAKLMKGSPSAGVTPYASHQEWMRDMKNPLYDKDPAFREKVASKLLVSKI